MRVGFPGDRWCKDTVMYAFALYIYKVMRIFHDTRLGNSFASKKTCVHGSCREEVFLDLNRFAQHMSQNLPVYMSIKTQKFKCFLTFHISVATKILFHPSLAHFHIDSNFQH